MEIFVRGENLKVTKAIENYAKDKLGRINKYIGDSNNVRATIVLNVKNHNQKYRGYVCQSIQNGF